MRRCSLLLLAACATNPSAPGVTPADRGANVATLSARRAETEDPQRSAGFYAALLGGRVQAEGATHTVRIEALGAKLDFAPASAVASPPEPFEFTVLDLDRALVELAIRGIAFELRETDGTVTVAFTDPDGRAVALGGR